MSVAALLNKTCTVTRSTWVTDAVTFERTQTRATTTGVPCAVQGVSEVELGRPTNAASTTYDLYFAYGADVESNDLISSITGLTNMIISLQSGPLDDAGRGAYLRFRGVHVTGGAAR